MIILHTHIPVTPNYARKRNKMSQRLAPLHGNARLHADKIMSRKQNTGNAQEKKKIGWAPRALTFRMNTGAHSTNKHA